MTTTERNDAIYQMALDLLTDGRTRSAFVGRRYHECLCGDHVHHSRLTDHAKSCKELRGTAKRVLDGGVRP